MASIQSLPVRRRFRAGVPDKHLVPAAGARTSLSAATALLPGVSPGFFILTLPGGVKPGRKSSFPSSQAVWAPPTCGSGASF